MTTIINDEYKLVKEYYGKELQSSSDLKTNACCTSEGIDEETKIVLADIHDEILAKYYGCGLIKPELINGAKVLDLGCGAGRDVYVMSRLVGESGFVVGVDMTDEQLEVAEKHIEYHRDKYGYAKSNVMFMKGYIEDLDNLGFEENFFDIIISNCVVNLSPFKDKTLSGIYKLLKPGGEFYFSDVYSDRRIAKELVEDPILYGECLSGALYKKDFIRLAKMSGFNDPRIVNSAPITIADKQTEKLIGNIEFDSITYRLFKIDELEDACEDFGQAVIYKGTIPGYPDKFTLDKGHIFETGRSASVCGNTYLMLNKSRFSEHFEYFGTMNVHFGEFKDCGDSTDTFSNTSDCGC
jgi:ubiquinone/menaquinone biosynthesis C-methylase UbiE